MAGRMYITPIVTKGVNFLITDRPSEETLQSYQQALQEANVGHLVRVCEPSYDTSGIVSAGIEVHDWPYEDGAPPPDSIINDWVALCKATFKGPQPKAIAIHCVAGLGRAPVLVAISLIENGMSAVDAVTFIRKYRKGAINKKQLQFLQSYKKRGKCVIM